MAQAYTGINNPYQKSLIAFLLALITGAILSYNLTLFIAFIIAASIVSVSLFKPKILIYVLLATSSFLGYTTILGQTRINFFEGTDFQMNLEGLRNLLIISASIPLIIFNLGKVRDAKFFSPILIYVVPFTILTFINFSMDNLRIYTNIISPILFYFLMIIFIENEKNVDTAFKAIIFSSFIPMIIAILQYFNIIPVIQTYAEFWRQEIIGKRINATFDNANTFGLYIVMFSFISVFKLLKERHRIKNAIYFAGVHFSILITLSRNAVFGMLLAYALIAHAKWGLIRSVFVVLLLFAVLLSIPGLNERLLVPSQKTGASLVEMIKNLDYETLDKYSMGRIFIWEKWIREISKNSLKEHLLGNGFSYQFVKDVTYFHNEFLKMYWVAGAVGLIAFIYMIFYILFRLYLWMRMSLKGERWNIYYLCAFAYILTVTFMLNFDNILEKHQIWIYYFALLALAEKTKRKETEQKTEFSHRLTQT